MMFSFSYPSAHRLGAGGLATASYTGDMSKRHSNSICVIILFSLRQWFFSLAHVES